MLELILTAINARLSMLNKLANLYCLAERRPIEGGKTVPYAYRGGRDLQPINIDSGSVGYWRINGEGSDEYINDPYVAGQQRQVTWPLRFYAMAHRDSQFTASALADLIGATITDADDDVAQLLDMEDVGITVSGRDLDTTALYGSEFDELDLPYHLAFIALTVTVTVRGSANCFPDPCGIDTDILHSFNFCDAAIRARLTEAQVDCLMAALCDTPPTLCEQLAEVLPADVVADVFDCLTPEAQAELLDSECVIPPCADATITINSSSYGTVPSGGTENIIVESENNTQLGSLVGGNWEVGNAHLRVNGTTVGNFEPEQWHDHYATINGTQAGAWHNPSQTWRMTVLQGGVQVGSLSGTDWVVPVCADATAVLKNTANTTLSTTSIASGASQNITAPDATAVLKDTAGVTLSTTAIPSNTSTNITAPDGTVQLNGSAYGVVTSGGTINVNSLTYSRLPSKTWRFCYADRSLISGYTGALMQCRIATGGSTFDAVQDANGYMNTPAVVTSRGNDNITTPIIYDQAGSGVNMLQAVVANQPRLAVGSPNGKDRAIMYHAQTPYMQAAQSFALNSTETVYVVCRPNTINGALVCGSGTSWWLEMAGSNTVYVYNGSSYYATSGAVQLYSVCLLTLQLKLNALIVRINGVQILSQTPFALAASTSVTVGARPTGANPNNLGWKALCAHAGELDTSVESALMAAYRI